MPSKCRGRYLNVAVVDVEYWRWPHLGWRPAMISGRARGVVRIVRHYGPQSVGITDKCAYRRTLASAEALAHEYNNVPDQATAEQLIGAGGSA